MHLPHYGSANSTGVTAETVVVVLLFIYVNFFSECPQLSIPHFGSANDTAVKTGTVVKLSCSLGYTLFGTDLLTCQRNGSWNNELPSCYKGKIIQVSKGAKIRNRYNQEPHLTQDTNGKVTVGHHK